MDNEKTKMVLNQVRERSQLPDTPQCHNCKHFDLEEGQAAMRENPNFMKACAVVPPSRMGVPVMHGDDDKPLPPEQQPRSSVPKKATWEDFGACLEHEEVRYKHDVCELHEPLLRGKPLVEVLAEEAVE